MLTQEIKAYADYYDLRSNNEVLRSKENNPKKKWINERWLDTYLIAYLIEKEVTTNKIVEFSNTLYVDNKNTYPTIGDNFAKKGKEAIVLTPYVDSHAINDVYIRNVSLDNPYGPYSNFNKNEVHNLYKTNCFVTEKKLPRLSENFKIWAKDNITCIYAISGKLNDNLIKKDKEAFEFANNIVKNESLKCIEKELYNKKNNSIAKIYVIKNR